MALFCTYIQIHDKLGAVCVCGETRGADSAPACTHARAHAHSHATSPWYLWQSMVLMAAVQIAQQGTHNTHFHPPTPEHAQAVHAYMGMGCLRHHCDGGLRTLHLAFFTMSAPAQVADASVSWGNRVTLHLNLGFEEWPQGRCRRRAAYAMRASTAQARVFLLPRGRNRPV